MQKFDVVINGAGLVGSSIALALAAANFKVLIVEFAPIEKLYPKDDYGLRVSAFTPSSRKWLEYVGVWDQLLHSGRMTPFLHMHVWDAAGDGALQLDADGTGSDALGWILDNEATQGALLDRVKTESNITLLDNCKLVDFENIVGGVIVQVSTGEKFETELVIGADGGRSLIRDWANIPSTGWSYGQKTIVGQVKPERSHDNTCWQKFDKNGPVALLPLNDGRCSLAWHTTPQEADELLALDSEEFGRRLTEAFNGRFGKIEADWKLGAFPLRLNHARHYYRNHFVLAGDAAHNIHPLAGLGVNIGFLDAATLAEELMDARQQGLNLSDEVVLSKYEKRRKKHNMLIMGAMDVFKRSGGSDNFVMNKLRNVGLTVADKFPLGKRELAKFAMGYYGDIPKFIKP